MTVYLDSSFVVPLYVAEGQSANAAAILSSFSDQPTVSLLTDLEVASALHRKANSAQGRAGYELYRKDRAALTYREFVIDELVFQRARTLTEAYANRYLLRSLDALQVAIALHHGAEFFATFDVRQAEVARVLGLRVLP